MLTRESEGYSYDIVCIIISAIGCKNAINVTSYNRNSKINKFQ